ncbi:Conserved hypothetical protein [gamma proteobacterium HdN1]|nr:Conserved hypothetical protein [gamma proteobacterium HdN1]
MIEQVRVFYEGWGERWHWGTLFSKQGSAGRTQISFEYSTAAIEKHLELGVYVLPLAGPKLRQGFPLHQQQLPGPIYDALPDGWGMLLMDRLFKRQGLDPARISPLARLSYIGDTAMGALTFEPVLGAFPAAEDVSLLRLAQEVREVLNGEGGEFLDRLLRLGGSPQGARPKLLLYQEPQNQHFSTLPTAGSEAWLVKFPAQNEHAEVCAVERLYSHCLELCGIETPEAQYLSLPQGLAAFASKRFDRKAGLRIPIQTLAAFTGADYRVPGSLDYRSFLRATMLCTKDASQKAIAFERALFNVIFHNRDDHPKNFSYVMQKNGAWQIAPAYDVTFCEGPGGYHQMDVLGEALTISRQSVLRLGTQEAGLAEQDVLNQLDRFAAVARKFSQLAQQIVPAAIRPATLTHIQQRINDNLSRLQCA